MTGGTLTQPRAEKTSKSPSESESASDLGEVARARAEDPDFPVVLAKALAKGRGERYSPERHGPFKPVAPPKPKAEKKPLEGDLQALLGRFTQRGRRPRMVDREETRKDLL